MSFLRNWGRKGGRLHIVLSCLMPWCSGFPHQWAAEAGPKLPPQRRVPEETELPHSHKVKGKSSQLEKQNVNWNNELPISVSSLKLNKNSITFEIKCNSNKYILAYRYSGVDNV
jgi:hypothetical protein